MIRKEGVSVVFQVYYSKDLGGFEMEVVGVNGRFDAVGMSEFLRNSQSVSFSQIKAALEEKDDTSWDVEVEIRYAEPETQYGTGYGDILTLPGYYYLGDVMNVVEHERVPHSYRELLLSSGYDEAHVAEMSDEDCALEWEELCSKSPTV